jgi:hypothetical protein
MPKGGFWDRATQALPGAYQQSFSQYMANYRQQQQLAEQQRRQRIKDRLASDKARTKRMEDAAKEHAKVMQEHKDAQESMQQQTAVMKIANARLKPLVEKGTIGEADYSAIMEDIQANPKSAGSYVTRMIDTYKKAAAPKKGPKPLLLNVAFEKWAVGQPMDPAEERALREGLKVPILPRTPPPGATTFSDVQRYFNKEAKIGKAAEDIQLSRLRYDELMNNTQLAGDKEKYLSKPGGYKTYEEWMKDFKQRVEYGKAQKLLQQVTEEQTVRDAAMAGRGAFGSQMGTSLLGGQGQQPAAPAISAEEQQLDAEIQSLSKELEEINRQLQQLSGGQ